MAVLKRRRDSEETKAKTSQEQQYKPEAVTSVDESTNINLGQTTTGTTDTNAGNVAQSANTANTSGAAGSADYNAHPYYNEGGTTTGSTATGGTNLATNTSGDVTITDAEEVTPTSTTEEVKVEAPTETVTETETEKEPEPTPEPTAETETETETETEPAPAPTDNGMPTPGTKYADLAADNAPKEHTPEELEDAKKRGRRESRMATAGHIMDTLARVLNYAATTQGAPSAHWSNRNREFDKNTYYDRMKKENEEARKNYFNMMLAGAGQDTKDYQSRLAGWNAGREDARKEAEEQRKKDLHPGNLEAQGLANESAGLKNEAQRIANENAPREQELKNKLLQAQIDHTKAGTAKTYEEIRKSKASGSGSGSSTSDMWLPKLDDNGEPVIVGGQPQYIQYDNMNDYLAARAYLADKYNIDSRKRKDEYQWGMKTKEELGADQISNIDFAKIVGDSIMSQNGVPGLAR